MREHIDPVRFVERVLESDAPVWHLWDGEDAKLISTLALIAQAECASTKAPTTRAIEVRLARLMWLLDRLTPENDNSILEPYLASARGVYAWGRRLPSERRNELLTIPLPVGNKNWQRTRYVQFLLLAWCDSCPRDQIETLLDWHEQWWPALLLSDKGWLPSPVREFYRRCAEPPIARRERIYTAIEKYLGLLGHDDDATRSEARRLVLVAWLILLREVATENPSSNLGAYPPEDLPRWFDLTLSEEPFSRLAEIDRVLPVSPNRNQHWARWVWIWRHSRANWRNLHEYALCNPDERVFERLVEITPEDDLEPWDDLLFGRSEDHGEMRAFCRWVQPRFAEALREHFFHSDSDWRTCAFLSYVSKTSEPQLRHLWRGESGMPAWQTRQLDRRLFAPEAARPAALLEDRQKIIADPRLRDPFTP